MAKKKRKAGKAPQSSFSASASATAEKAGNRSLDAGAEQAASGIRAWLFPALGWLALVLAWLALLGGFSDGTIDPRVVFHVDAVQPRVIFHALFTGEGKGWASTGTAPFYLDFPFQWALTALGANLAATIYLTALFQAVVPAVGWILACDFLFGKSPARRLVVLLLHALPMLIVAWRGPDFFWVQIMTTTHYSSWMTLPWLLWLSLRVLAPDSAGGTGKRRSAPIPAGWAAGLVGFLAVSVANGLFIIPWFVAPAGLAAVLLAWTGKLERRRAMWFVGMLAAGCVLGRLVLFRLPPLFGLESWRIQYSTDFGLALTLKALGNIAAHHWHAAARNPTEAAAWLAFAAVAGWRAVAVFRPSVRRETPPALGIPDGARHSLAALFVPAAMLCSLAVPAAAGLSPDYFGYLRSNAPGFSAVGAELRYHMPNSFFPLFTGWALLPGIRFRRAAMTPGLAALAALAALSLPKAARVDHAALDPFNTPFYQCFAENARRLNWRAGLGNLDFGMIMTEVPGAEMERMMSVGTFRRPGAGQSFMVVDVVFNLNVSGEYQFVAANSHDGRVFAKPPLAGETGCAADEPEACWHPVADNFVLDDASARAAFGEPQEVVNCAGVGLFHYDPPLKFDLTHLEHPYLAPVARW